MQFKEPTFTEEGDKFCNMCEFTTQNSEELASHYRDTHDVALSSDGLDEGESCGDEETGLDQPKVTSSGKVKQFRCKQCSHTAMTKREFWEHTRGHIKAERLLTCPKCPFVTEYKHHFEYHLRNHFGSKPFKCDQCSYSCVNKSMLNSHLKSHSNVYQFRCSDCAYATKYCHSLKLHLRKYQHKPAMVLNPDGSPNPLPIVDVYGTRRGPKTRTKKSAEDYVRSVSPVPTALSPLYPVPPMILPPPQFPYGFQFPTPLETELAAEEFAKLKQLYQLNNNTDYRNGVETMNYLSTAPLDLSKTELSSQDRSTAKSRRKGVAVKRVFTSIQDSFGEIREPKMAAMSMGPQMFCSPELSSPDKSESDSKSRASLSNTDESMSTDSVDVSGTDLVPGPVSQQTYRQEPVSRMDMEQAFRQEPVSRLDTEQSFRQEPVSRLDTEPVFREQVPEPVTRAPNQEFRKTSEPVSRVPVELGKLPDQVSEVDGHRTPENSPKCDILIKKEENNNEEIVRGGSKPTTPDTSCTNSTDENENQFRCSFCDIIFKNLAMYSIHMGFHDYRDPFTCNMCGHKTKDEMAFFLHIARFPHS